MLLARDDLWEKEEWEFIDSDIYVTTNFWEVLIKYKVSFKYFEKNDVKW